MQVFFPMCCGLHVPYPTIHKGSFKKFLLMLLKEHDSQSCIWVEINIHEKLLKKKCWGWKEGREKKKIK